MPNRPGKRTMLLGIAALAIAGAIGFELGPSPGGSFGPPRLEGSYWTYGFMMSGNAYFDVEPDDAMHLKARAVPDIYYPYQFRVDYSNGRTILMQRLAPEAAAAKPLMMGDPFRPGREWEPL